MKKSERLSIRCTEKQRRKLNSIAREINGTLCDAVRYLVDRYSKEKK